jgi:hypothetical protein
LQLLQFWHSRLLVAQPVNSGQPVTALAAQHLVHWPVAPSAVAAVLWPVPQLVVPRVSLLAQPHQTADAVTAHMKTAMASAIAHLAVKQLAFSENGPVFRPVFCFGERSEFDICISSGGKLPCKS